MPEIEIDKEALLNAINTTYTTKNSGENVVYENGTKRENKKGKIRYDLIPLPMLKRLAELYTRGAEVYGDRNWETGNLEYAEKCKESLWRHFIQYMNDETDEDHMAAVVWNLFARETLLFKNK